MTPAEKKAAWRKKRKLECWGAPVPEGLRHGKRTTACDTYGCGCKVCLPSGRRKSDVPLTALERGRRLRASKKGTPVPPGTKHGIYTYRVYGCKCDFCTAANRRSRTRERHTWRETAVGHWSTRRGNDVLHWPPAGDGTWTCPECGEQFEMRGKSSAAAA